MSSKQRAWALTVIRAFEDADLTTNDEVQAAGGPSTTTVSKYRGLAEGRLNLIPEPRADVYRKIDRAARWAPGSARRLWRDGTPPQVADVPPTYRDAAEAPPARDVPTQFRQIAERQLAELLDQAATEAAQISETDPAAAEQIIQDALRVATDLRRALDRALDQLYEPNLSDPGESLPAAAKRGAIEESGESDI